MSASDPKRTSKPVSVHGAGKIALLFLIHMGRDARDSTTNNSAVMVSSDAHMMKSDLQLGKNF
jgi:hypothetical protein